MKTMITKGIMAFAIVALATSCSTSNDVASNRGIQKRKYNKGFFVSKNTKSFDKKSKTENTKQILVEEEVAEVINSQTEASNEMNSNKNISLDENNNIAEQSNTKTSTKTNLKESTIKIDKNKSDVKDYNTFENNEISKKDVKRKKKRNPKTKRNPSSDVDLILLILIAIFIPPLAVFLYEGVTTRFWIDLILTLLGWGILGWLLPGAFLLGGLIAIIYALLIVTGTI